MKTGTISILILLCAFSISGQDSRFYFSYGYGSYKMDRLKEFQTEYFSFLNPTVPDNLIEDLPNNEYLEAAWKFKLTDQFKMGFILGYHSTGSRLHYTDNSSSPELIFKINTHAYTFGFDVERNIFRSGYFSIWADAAVSFYSTRIKMNEVVFNTNTYALKYEAVSPTFEPGILFNYSFKPFTIGLHAGYLLDPGARLFSDYSNYRAADKNGPNWTGFRVGISAGLNIVAKRHFQEGQANDNKPVIRMSFLVPAISVETGLGKKVSLFTEIGSGFSYMVSKADIQFYANYLSSPGDETPLGKYFKFTPFAKFEERYYYNFAKRKTKNKPVDYFNGNYISHYNVYILNETFWTAFTWGMQRNYGHFFINLNLGAGIGAKNKEIGPVIITEFKAGFRLN